MNIKNHVVSLELSKQLKISGYPQQSFFYWAAIGDSWTLRSPDYPKRPAGEIVAAPLASELGEQLPMEIEKHGLLYELHICKNTEWGEWYCNYSRIEKTELLGYGRQDKSEADARAKMWLYLKQEGLLTQ